MRLMNTVAVIAGVVSVAVVAQATAQGLPAEGGAGAARLDASPRHGEWVTYAAGDGDSVLAWIVFPERGDPAPVVVVIHEIFGLTDWIRGVADQLAAEGFIAIAPDLLTGKGPDGGGSASVDRQGAVRLIRALDRDEVNTRLQAAGRFGMALPAARRQVASIGFCWGGSTSFRFAASWSDLSAAVVYYGTSPPAGDLATIEARILGLYGGDDARVNATIDAAREEMRKLGKSYEAHVYDGAGHGFLRQQSGRNGANLRASQEAWPRTIEFLRGLLGN